MTGLISLRGAGRFIDINHNEDEKVDYVLDNYSTYSSFTDERAYFDYMAKVDPNLMEIKAVAVSASEGEEFLKNWVDEFPWNKIKEELKILSKRRTSSDEVLRILSAPIRLEFLTALAIKSRLPHVRVIPNYAMDDTGLPTSTAGGGKGDIECIEQHHGILVEVTMLEGSTQRIVEIIPIERHLVSFKEKYTEDSQCIFVAPSIYCDSQREIAWIKFDSNGKNVIRPYKIDDFVNFLENSRRLYLAEP